MAEVMIEIMVGVNPNGDWMSVMMSGSDGADIASAKEFNKAVQENNYAEVPAAMTSVLALRNAAELFFLDENLRMQIRARLDAVYSLISTLRK